MSAAVEWRYLPGGVVRHAVFGSGDPEAACGRYTVPASNWMGTGCQREYERVETLRPCRDCVWALARQGVSV